MRVPAVCGSLQSASRNLDLLRLAATKAPVGVEVRLFLEIGALPHFNPDLERSGMPTAVTVWREALAACDAVLMASPEYGHSLPGVLKNAIDWVIGSGELHQKVVAITVATGSLERGQRGLGALRQTLLAVDAVVVGGVPTVLGPTFEKGVELLVSALIEAAQRRHIGVDPARSAAD